MTPTEPVGRIVAALVMVTSIGLITVITAAVTSTSVAAATRREARTPDIPADDARPGFEEVALRLDRIEEALGLQPDTSTSDVHDG